MTNDIKQPRRFSTDLPITRLIPNMLTVMSLCSGLTAIRFALDDKWAYSVLAVMVAAVFDVLDGRVARMLNHSSKFGAELDSLSDLVSFGVAPGLIMYQWVLHDYARFGWIATLVFVVCSALRLARFNTMLEDASAPAWAKGYFTGVPTPAGAGLFLIPLVAALEFGDMISLPAPLVAAWGILVGGLMVSRLPTFALKGWRISRFWVVPVFIAVVLFVATLITNTWLALVVLGSTYAATLPLSWYNYRRRLLQDAASRKE